MKGPVVENVVLTVHLILAVLLIGVVLLQRSEGGGLGMGGGGGGGNGVMTGRQAANALTRITWGLAVAFLVTSLALTIIAARNASSGSIVDQLGLGGNEQQPTTTLPGIGDYAPPPAAGQPVLPPVPGGTAAPATTAPATDQNSGPITPSAPAAEAPATEAPATQAPATEAPAADAPATPAPAQN
ncbi:preprotein translocase subunit SecG [Paracoccus shanxieyensis]|uniref:Protein-export membrane protein SecG n=1 Tax=Paracoccus shanxieyensis TaxID=2675752 RepID=A0A6L6IYZ6_9RHOB|nr:preprotein translocase subunit SecG [Paracoccus shanxieyensis]MTH64798.1 preprotein translocase subunit SecG [Paracoccus shanxieyensis]MTH87969.1 preprotein translocase subunit SecG [Paracoccus shanxieyensis]